MLQELYDFCRGGTVSSFGRSFGRTLGFGAPRTVCETVSAFYALAGGVAGDGGDSFGVVFLEFALTFPR